MGHAELPRTRVTKGHEELCGALSEGLKDGVIARYGQLSLKEARHEAQRAPAPALQATHSSLGRPITCRR